MLTLQQIKEDPKRVVERLAIKGFDGAEPIGRVLDLDTARRELQTKNDGLAREQNQFAARIGGLMKQGKREEAEATKAEVAKLKNEQKVIAEQVVGNRGRNEADIAFNP